MTENELLSYFGRLSLDDCNKLKMAIALFGGRILPSVNESLREEPIDIDVTVLDSDVLDRLAKDL
ncbi:hypothetical protein F2Q68_00024152 [Brassica cretica]|uniref:NET domain-containing protein n=2 Tax=Brassica cretica TaxID=69181 RepID=A0ABQ7DG95_BRACR|nr:hypothetical protein F2Q68_00024152 [Brassica cretica]KAF3576624.1 hypothetical protein DY000_02028970 [Brassica cretica]